MKYFCEHFFPDELVHAFDTRQVEKISIVEQILVLFSDFSGRFFDAFGNLKNWWQDESTRAFEERAQCFVDQYNQYKIDDQQIDGILTLDENVRRKAKQFESKYKT